MKIGILLATYQDYECLDKCLKPWVALKNELNISIAITQGQFKEYNELGYIDEDSKTIEKLIKYYQNKAIDFLYLQNQNETFNTKLIYQTESELRNHGLKWLLSQDIDYFFTIGSDEYFTVQEISNVINYIQKDEFISVYNIEYKNLVFNNNTYIKGFAPQRIWKVNLYDNYRLDSFVYDDDCAYIDRYGTKILDKQLSHKKIPINLCNPVHHTWNHLERSKQKIKYAEKRWSPPNGNGCSFKIDEGGQSISFNMDYYNRIRENAPELFKLNENTNQV